MNCITHQCLVLFLKLRGLNRGEPETDGRPPFGISILACLGCFALVYTVAPPGEVLFGSWWIKLLFYALLPVTVTFTIMYRSC
ncbi:MAG TPA: hypothetical protein VG347_22170 [Verrucomicrobiae bacterium]|nr:hypothetical protein [Verrucomicrobiae bacterium]